MDNGEWEIENWELRIHVEILADFFLL